MGKQKLSQSQITTIIVTSITVVGSIVGAYFTFRGNTAPLEIAIGATQTAEIKSLTLTPQFTGMPSSIDVTSTPTLPTAVQPTVQLLNGLTSAEDQAVQFAASGILQVAQQLPLIARDDFDSNEYGWAESQDIFDQGVQCTKSIKEGKYSIALQSTSQVTAWCSTLSPRKVNNFYLSVDFELVQNRNTDILFYYQYVDDGNFNYLIMTPQTQTIALGIRENGKDNLLVQSTFIPSIHKDKVNKLTMLALAGSHTIYINDHLEILVSNEKINNQGLLLFGIRLNEADQLEEFLMDNYDLRGD
jgi:hypothetical protein